MGARAERFEAPAGGSALEPPIFAAAPAPRDRVPISRSARDRKRPLTMESRLFDTNAEENEVPPEPLSFVLGRDGGGRWIVQEAHGVCGGLFASQDAAIRYAKSEAAERGRVIRLVPDPIELKCRS